MDFVYDKSGFSGEMRNVYPIDKDTVIGYGDLVEIKNGKIVKCTGEKPVGFAVSRHEKGDGEDIFVLDSPTAVFTLPVKKNTTLQDNERYTVKGALTDDGLLDLSQTGKYFIVLKVCDNKEAFCTFAKHFYK